MYFRNFTTLLVKYSYLYFSSHGVYGSKVMKRNKHQNVNSCRVISHHWSNMYNMKKFPDTTLRFRSNEKHMSSTWNL